MSRKLVLMCAFVGIAAAAAPAALRLPVCIAYNASASAPLGWYRVRTNASLQVGDYVLATLPNDAGALAAQRGYLPAGLPVLKQVAAVAGQHVCARGEAILINDKIFVHVLRSDRNGRPLPAWRQCRSLIDGELFLANSSNTASFDSRYFGPVAASAVLGQAIPLWTWSVMKTPCLRPPGCRRAASPTHVAVHPSCKPSPPELWHRSAPGAGKTEGKIEGDGTAVCLELGLHEGGRGTCWHCSRAAVKSNAAPMLVLPRAVFALIGPAAMESPS